MKLVQGQSFVFVLNLETVVLHPMSNKDDDIRPQICFMLHVDWPLPSECRPRLNNPSISEYNLIAMAFWFGITSMIRPTGLERISASFVLASMKQGLSAATLELRMQQIQRSSQTYSYFAPNFGGADVMCNTAPRYQYLFLECSSGRGNDLVLRATERERDSSTYCITGTEYEWMPASAHRAGYKWKRS